MRILRKFTGNLRHLITRHAGNLLLPGRRVGDIVIVAAGDVIATQTLIHPVVGHIQVIHGGDQHFAVGSLDLAHRHATLQHVAMRSAVEVLVCNVAEVRECRFNDGIVLLNQRKARLDLATIAGLFLQVPLALVGGCCTVFFLTPAETDRTHRHGQRIGRLIDDKRFPVRVIGFAERAD